MAQAREQLAAAQPALALGPVPWEDGESLRYSIALPTGKVIGSMYLGAESTEVDGSFHSRAGFFDQLSGVIG